MTELERRLAASLAAGANEEALRLAYEISDRHAEQHQEGLYRLARLHLRAGRRADGYLCLRAAVDAGFYDVARLQSDDVFCEIRDEALFKTLVRGAWAKGYARLLERPDREEIQKPAQVIEALALRPGERVVEIGPGTGYFTIPVARALGPGGRLRAVDASPEMLDFLAVRLEAERLANVETVRVSRDDPALPPGEADTILVIDTLHYVEDRVGFARKLAIGLAGAGRIVIIDYIPRSMEERPWGPPPEQQIPRQVIDAEMAAAGFRVAASHDFLPEQYFVEYRRTRTRAR